MRQQGSVWANVQVLKLYPNSKMNANSLHNSWTSLCPPAQIYPIVMTSVVLFNLYRGTYRYAITHMVALVIGTIFLWVLCAANLEFAAYALLLFPILFFAFFMAVLFYDQSYLSVHHEYRACGCCDEPQCDCC